jgi:hypothetical protein
MLEEVAVSTELGVEHRRERLEGGGAKGRLKSGLYVADSWVTWDAACQFYACRIATCGVRSSSTHKKPYTVSDPDFRCRCFILPAALENYQISLPE